VLREGARASADEIKTFIGERMAPYKVPKAVEFRSELPLAFTGKVLRRVLADEERARGDHLDRPASFPGPTTRPGWSSTRGSRRKAPMQRRGRRS